MFGTNFTTFNLEMTVKLEDLIEPYGKMISIVCHRMIQDEEKARDAAQEVWMNIAASLPSFRGGSKIST